MSPSACCSCCRSQPSLKLGRRWRSSDTHSASQLMHSTHDRDGQSAMLCCTVSVHASLSCMPDYEQHSDCPAGTTVVRPALRAWHGKASCDVGFAPLTRDELNTALPTRYCNLNTACRCMHGMARHPRCALSAHGVAELTSSGAPGAHPEVPRVRGR